MSGGIFISYRREDANHAAARLVDRLSRVFQSDQLFIDVDNIPPGVDFTKVLSEKVAACNVLIAVIGPRWLQATDDTGQLRLHSAKDFVRIEIEAALARDILVIPVLVDNARMPREQDLPATLQPLVNRNAVRLTHERFGVEADGLTKALEDVVPRTTKRGWFSRNKLSPPKQPAPLPVKEATTKTAPPRAPRSSAPPLPPRASELAEGFRDKGSFQFSVMPLFLGGLGVLAFIVVAAIGTLRSGPTTSPPPSEAVLTPPAPQPATMTEKAKPPSPNPPQLDMRSAMILEAIPYVEPWSYAKTVAPDWYGQQMTEAKRLVSEQKNHNEIMGYLVDQLIAFRRTHTNDALASSYGSLRQIADAFLDAVRAQPTTSACYDFISRGEKSPSVLDTLGKMQRTSPIQAQQKAILAAISEGMKTPVTRQPPTKADYNVLTAQLNTLGWTEKELKLFADPKALAAAPQADVCSMIQDWFKAHLAIKDQAVSERLLVETLRPVVGG